MFCPNCGKEIKDDIKFCPNCGYKRKINSDANEVKDNRVEQEFTQQSVNQNIDGQTKQLNPNVIKKFLGILFVLIMIIIAIFFISTNNNKNVMKSDEYGKYYLDENGDRVYDKWVKYKNKYYHIDYNGYADLNKWIEHEYYVNQNGEMVEDDWVVDSNNNWYYLGEDGKYLRNGLFDIKGKKYYFNHDGTIVANIFFQIPGTHHISFFNADGSLNTSNGFVEINGETFFINSDGKVIFDEWVEKNGEWYYMDSAGHISKNKWIQALYYVGEDGKMLKNTKSPEGYEIDNDGKVLERYRIFLLDNITPEQARQYGLGTVEGVVTVLTGGSSVVTLPDARVDFYKQEDPSNIVGSTKTDANGKYRYYLPAGNYNINIKKDGYQDVNYEQNITGTETKYNEMVKMFVYETGQGSAGGILKNALTGQTVANATIRLRIGWNNEVGDYYGGFSTTTDSQGRYQINNIPVGYYTIEATKSDFVKVFSNIAVLKTNPIYDFNFSINPIMPNDGNIRIVLTWGENPRDLDSHLIGRKPNGNYFDVYFSNKVYNYNSVAMANLDVDDTDGDGPETITITSDINGRYVYGVHDYTNKSSTGSNKLSYSNCKVTLYMGSGIVGVFNVPAGQIGTFWEVFSVDENRNVTPINRIYNYNPIDGSFTNLNIPARTNPIYSAVETTTSSNNNYSSGNSNSGSSISQNDTSSSSSFNLTYGSIINEEYYFDDDKKVTIKIKPPQVAGGSSSKRNTVNENLTYAVDELIGICQEFIDDASTSPKTINFNTSNIVSQNSSQVVIKMNGVVTYRGSSDTTNLNYTVTIDIDNNEYHLTRS